LVAILIIVVQSAQQAGADSSLFTGTVNAPEVHVIVDLKDPLLHPRQLAYDAGRNGLWFWTSTEDQRQIIDNRLYFYDIAQQHLSEWRLPDTDWSSQVLAGLAVDAHGAIWVGWNHNLVAFDPDTASAVRYQLPQRIEYPLSSSVLGDLPSDLGIADLVAAQDGTIWIARYGAVSLTSFVPSNHQFHEYPLPASIGDPARLALAPDGDVFFTVNLSADHPGYAYEKVGDFHPATATTTTLPQGATALAVCPQGDLYTVLGNQAGDLKHLSAPARAQAAASGQAPRFEANSIPFGIADTALACDPSGRLWMAVAGQPRMAVQDGTGHITQFQYAAAGQAAHPIHSRFMADATPAPDAVWLSPIVAMVTDAQGHLYYIRTGWSQIEEVAA
jgi:streptogramin lyase